MSELLEVAGYRCMVVAEGDACVRTSRDVVNLIGDAMGADASVLAVPVRQLDASFFQLRSGFAGEVLQTMANYRLKFAVIGDVSTHVATSQALNDLVVESNHSTSFFFTPDMETFELRLSRIPAAARGS